MDESTTHANYSTHSSNGRATHTGGQVVGSGFPIWLSPVRPGSCHDLACARELVLPALYPHTALGLDGHSHLPVLADKGYIGAGIGVRTPVPRPSAGQVLDRTTRTYNALLTGLGAPAERGNALLQRWRALERVSLDPWRITTTAAAALILTSLDRGTRRGR